MELLSISQALTLVESWRALAHADLAALISELECWIAEGKPTLVQANDSLSELAPNEYLAEARAAQKYGPNLYFLLDARLDKTINWLKSCVGVAKR